MKELIEIEDGFIFIRTLLSSPLQLVSIMNLVVKEYHYESTDTDKLSTDFGANTQIRFSTMFSTYMKSIFANK